MSETDSIPAQNSAAHGGCPAATCYASLCGRVKLYLGDSLTIAPTLKVVDALITDPPYGMGLDTDFSGMNGWGGKGHKYERIIGDDEPFDPTPWLSYGKAQVLWGAQYFCHKLPQVGGWLVFNKRGDGKPSEICFGDAELAWKSTGKAVRMFSAMWHGVARWSSEGRLHPTQKPVALMAWCMEQAKVPQGALVLDPYMGSGTTGIAAIRTGRRFIGIEKDPTHYATALKRITNELAQGDLFLGHNSPIEPTKGSDNTP